MLTVLCHGRPPQVLVAAFDLDERTGADGPDRAGRHGQASISIMSERQVELDRVQVDEMHFMAVAGQAWTSEATTTSTPMSGRGSSNSLIPGRWTGGEPLEWGLPVEDEFVKFFRRSLQGESPHARLEEV